MKAEPEKSIMEKHIQTILVSIITALALWIGFSVNNQGVAIATLTERVGALQVQIRNNPALTKDDVLLLMAPQRETMIDLQGRVGNNTDRLNRIEKDLYVSYPNPSIRIEK